MKTQEITFKKNVYSAPLVELYSLDLMQVIAVSDEVYGMNPEDLTEGNTDWF